MTEELFNHKIITISTSDVELGPDRNRTVSVQTNERPIDTLPVNRKI